MMKRRLFLKGILGASVVVPVVVKAVTDNEVPDDFVEALKYDAVTRDATISGNHLLTPEEVTREAFNILNRNLRLQSSEIASYTTVLDPITHDTIRIRKLDNVLHLRYEDLTKNKEMDEIPVKYRDLICDFLGIERLDMKTSFKKPVVV